LPGRGEECLSAGPSYQWEKGREENEEKNKREGGWATNAALAQSVELSDPSLASLLNRPDEPIS